MTQSMRIDYKAPFRHEPYSSTTVFDSEGDVAYYVVGGELSHRIASALHHSVRFGLHGLRLEADEEMAVLRGYALSESCPLALWRHTEVVFPRLAKLLTGELSPFETAADPALKEGPAIAVEYLQGTVTEDDGTEKICGFDIISRIGRGACGEVRLVVDSSGRPFAMKTIPNNSASANEVLMMRSLQHRHVVQLHSVIADPEEDALHLVMPYFDKGTVTELNTEGFCDRVSVSTAILYVLQVASALEYLHHRDIIHRDIKPENILFADDSTVRLADFGCSCKLTDVERLRRRAGTPAFMSPELVESPTAGGVQSDVWALGVLLYCLVWGMLPFNHADSPTLCKSIVENDVSFPSLESMPPSPELEDLVRELLEKDPARRLTLSGLLHHPTMKKLNTT